MAKTKPGAIRVTGVIHRNIETLVARLENRAKAELRAHPVLSSDLEQAARYLRLIFPYGHKLYRTPWVRRSQFSSEGCAAESMVAKETGSADD